MGRQARKGNRSLARPAVGPSACANCGHAPEQHMRLPGHPDGAEECFGDDDCPCGQYQAGRA